MKEQLASHSFRLSNGLNCYLTPAPTWQIRLFSEIPVLTGDPGRFQAAANHLIEHAILVPEDELFDRGCTRLNLVKLDVVTPQTEEEAKKLLDRLGRLMTTPKLRHLTAERERIFEEWAGACDRIKQDMSNWGSFTQPATQENLDPPDPHLTLDQALHYLNRQADWTKAFTEKELTGQMKYLLGAQNLTLRVNGPMDPSAFYQMLKHSTMAHIPTQHPDAVQIAYRDVPEAVDYTKIHTSTTKIPLTIPPQKEEAYYKVMRAAINVLRHDKDIGLYWVRKNKTDQTTDWSFEITSPKENLLKAVLWGYLLEQAISQKNTELRQVAEDIMIQAKGPLRRNESQVSLQNLRKQAERS